MRNIVNESYEPALLAFQKGGVRYILLCGGRAGGRSYFASQIATASLLAQDYFRCAIMRYVLGDIRNSIFQEIVDRLEEQGVEKDVDIREHNLSLEHGNNSINGIGFRKSSGDQKAKLKSLASYNCVIIEEADEVQEEDFQQLDDSLRKIGVDITVFMMFNLPPKNHWIVKRWFNLIPSEAEGFYTPVLKDIEAHNTNLIHQTINEKEINLNTTTIDNFERYRETRPDHYWNMIRGLVSDGARGRIFKNWQPISDKEYDELDYSVFYGLDFGFTNDPTAIVEVKMHNDNVYVKELLYQTGLINVRISDKLKDMGINGSKEIYCDSAEPKSVAELRTYNWNAISADKGAGSRKAGVDLLLGKNIYYTESSTNLISEMQTYCWALNKEKEPTNEPSDGNDHLLDAFRYAVYTKVKQPYIGF